MSAAGLLELLGDLPRYVRPLAPMLVFVALASVVVAVGATRRALAGWRLGTLMAVSIFAAIYGGYISFFDGTLAESGTPDCFGRPPNFICGETGKTALTFTVVLGPLLLGLSALLLTWLPKRLPFGLRVVGSLAALAAPRILQIAYSSVFRLH